MSYRHDAGIDVRAKAYDVAVPASNDPRPMRYVGAYTADLKALGDWLTTCGITTVALGPAGVYYQWSHKYPRRVWKAHRH
jgi:transposase